MKKNDKKTADGKKRCGTCGHPLGGSHPFAISRPGWVKDDQCAHCRAVRAGAASGATRRRRAVGW